MEITTKKNGHVTIVTIQGQIDAATSKTAEERLVGLINAGEQRMVLDLAQLDYISSLGLRVLIMVAKRLKQMDGTVVVCGLQPAVLELFEIAGFDTVFRLFDTEQEAVTHAAG